MQELLRLGVTAIVELPPAGTLAGLAKRAMQGVEIVTLNTPDDLAAARDLFARHGGAPTGEPEASARVVVAASAGNFSPPTGSTRAHRCVPVRSSGTSPPARVPSR